MKNRYVFDNGSKSIAIITALFSLPILLSGILYQDDILRSANGEAYWGALGRPLSDVVVMGLGFGNDFVVNLFPLTLILATILLAASSIVLYNRFAIKKDIPTGIAFSLFSLSPFFLQNLSYQFDSFPMMLGVFLAVLPYSLSIEKLNIKLKVCLSSLFIIMSLCLYQATVNIFIAICALEVLSIIYRTNNAKVAFKTSLIRSLSLLIALIIYMKVITPLYLAKAVKSDLIFKADKPLESLQVNINKFLSIIESLANPQFFIGWSLLLIISCVALVSIIVKIINNNHSKSEKTFSVLLVLASIPVAIFSIAGPFILVDKTIVAPRVMMGLSSVMLIAAFLSTTLNYKSVSAIACIIPALLSLSLSSAYGNASKSQRSIEDKIFYDIASSIPESWNGSKIYLSGSIKPVQAAEMEFRRFPVLKLMVIPLNNWSGMVMLKHYNINVTMGNETNIPNSSCSRKNNYYSLCQAKNNYIILK